MDIFCNVRTCRKPLSGALWVTSCFHSFCEEHAKSLTHKNIKCPACNTVLGKRYDVIRQNSRPSDDFRAMLLVGLRPDIICDMAMHAISFWNYQLEQELKFQSNSAKRYKETAEKIKDNHATMVKQLTLAKTTSAGHERLVGELKAIVKQLREQIASKERQLQKMQHMFNSIKSKTHAWPPDIPPAHDNFSPTHVEDSLRHRPIKNGNHAAKKSEEFVFEPCFTSMRND